MDELSRELDAIYSLRDIDYFLNSFGIQEEYSSPYGESRVEYVKRRLKDTDSHTLGKIAEELDVTIPSVSSSSISPPKYWMDGKYFRLFISHLAAHKDKATRLKEVLAPYRISCFVAHEDILPTLEWQSEIEKALYVMDAMLTIHTKGFSESVWTQQEIGFAVGRGTKIVPLKMDEDPKGFIAKNQAIIRRHRNAEEISKEIITILTNDPATKSKMAEINSIDRSRIDDEIPF